MSDRDLSDYERKILDNIDEHGWFDVNVFDPDGKEGNFSYSVGFTKTLDCPEFIIFGLPLKLAHSMLWEIFRQIQAGKRPEDGMRWSDLVKGFDCISRAVHPTNILREYLNSAIWFWGWSAERAQALQAFQLVWPGAQDGKFPWEPDCVQIVRDYQPPLYLPNRSLS